MTKDLEQTIMRLVQEVMRLNRIVERLDYSDSRHERRIDELVRLVEPRPR